MDENTRYKICKLSLWSVCGVKMNFIRYFIYFITLFYLVACGRNFKTLNVDTGTTTTNGPKNDDGGKPLDLTNGPIGNEPRKNVDSAVSEIWMQDIPNKYDDVGDFFRIKEVPGLKNEQIIDSMEIKGSSAGKTLELIRGKLRLSGITHHFDAVKNQLEVKGDVVFNDGNPIGFALSGSYISEDGVNIISLQVVDEKSPLKNLFRAKASCSSNISTETTEKETGNADFCKKLTIDFYYRDQNRFYTDQLISKGILFEEIKRSEAPVELVPDLVFENVPEEGLSDYEKSQKQGIRDGVADGKTIDELPYYFIEPNIDDVAKLYPDVSRVVEEQKKNNLKAKKKIKAVPKLTGEEKIPEKDPQLPQPAEATTGDVKPPPVTTAPPVPVTKPPTPPPPPVKVQPAPPAKPPAPPPSVQNPPTTKPPVIPPIMPVQTGPRPVNQAWGMPDTGKKVGNKMFYLTQSNSILEATQKLGVDAGFIVLHPTKKRHYATYDMVEMIVDLGAWLKESMKELNLFVGDASAVNGGPIGHASHKTGMDVDVAYLTRNPKMIFMRMDVPNKPGYTHTDFAAAEQWQLMKVAHEVAPIEVIYVNRNIKNEMCKQALKAGDLKSPSDITSPAARILTKMVVEDANHGNHWHIRLDCNTLKGWRFQKECVSRLQAYVGPECKNVKQ